MLWASLGVLLSLVSFKQSRSARLIQLTFRVRLAAPRERLIHKLLVTLRGRGS